MEYFNETFISLFVSSREPEHIFLDTSTSRNPFHLQYIFFDRRFFVWLPLSWHRPNNELLSGLEGHQSRASMMPTHRLAIAICNKLEELPSFLSERRERRKKKKCFSRTTQSSFLCLFVLCKIVARMRERRKCDNDVDGFSVYENMETRLE